MIFAARLFHSPAFFWKCCLLSTLLATASTIPGRSEEIALPTPITTAASAAVTADAVQEAFVRVAQRIQPSVVTIYAERASPQAQDDTKRSTPEENPTDENSKSPFSLAPTDPDEDRTSLGTGMVLNAQGQILTNYHVVKDAAFIRVLFDSDSERPERPLARLVSFDEESDLAVLQLSPGTPRHFTLQPVEFADSEAVRVGEWAIAMGAPFDQTQTLTVGIISAKGRHLTKDGRISLQDYLQTDASINPGNSGGPLVNLEGKVIGINTAILSPSRFNVGIGFAVPSNAIQRYLPILSAGKSIGRGFLGIQYTALDEEVAREFQVPGGMQIGALAKRGEEFVGPAKNAGLIEGDIITQVDGRAVISSNEFRRLVAGSTPGTVLRFTVVRPNVNANETNANETLEFSVTLADWSTQAAIPTTPKPLSPPALPRNSPLGMRVENADQLTLVQKDKLGLNTGATGVIITDITVGLAADAAELQRGLRLVRARITKRKWQNLATKKEFLALENSLKPGDRVLLQVRDKQDVSLYKLLVVK